MVLSIPSMGLISVVLPTVAGAGGGAAGAGGGIYTGTDLEPPPIKPPIITSQYTSVYSD